LLPWRFVIVPADARGLLAEQFAKALLDRDAGALPDQVEQAREKAYRSPLLMLAAVNGACGDPDVDLNERVVSAGSAIQNMLLMATAQGFGSALTSGKALKSIGLRKLFQLDAQEHALCFISVGTVVSRKAQRARPGPADYASHLSLTQGVVGGIPPF
jgi:nitroreductase